jgi:transposase
MIKHEYLLKKQIKKLYFKLHSYDEIAIALGVKRHFIGEFCRKNKIYEQRERYYKYLVVYAYCNNMSIAKIAKQTGLKYTSLQRIKRKYGIETKRFDSANKKITEEMKNEMVDLYQQGFTCGEIIKKFGYKTSKTVEDVLKERKISTRPPRERRRYNYEYFNKIDSHDKAYILGLIYTDGYVYRDYAGFCIQLTENDGYLLEKIAGKIGDGCSVIHINCDSKRKSMKNVCDMTRLGVYSKIIGEQVKNLGVVKRKTYDLLIPENTIPQKFIYSFFRGVVDGDGSIGVPPNRTIWLRISTKSERFADCLCQLIPDGLKKYKYQTKYGDMFYLSLNGGNKNTIKVLKKMYKNKGDLYLQRKFDKIKHLLQH